MSGVSTPWKKLYAVRDTDSLVTTTGFAFDTFNELLVLFKPAYMQESPYKHPLRPQPSRRYFDAETCLGLTLAFLRCQAEQRVLSIVFGCAHEVTHQGLPPLGPGEAQQSGASQPCSFPVCDISNPVELVLPKLGP